MRFVGPRALIDLAALGHNLEVARRHAPRSRLWAVIKADAYGHGMERAAEALAAADGFAVARVEEALRLRATGVEHPILVLNGALSAEETAAAWEARLDLAVHQAAQADWLEALPRSAAVAGHPSRIWLKVDTGMHRLGLEASEVPRLQAQLADCPVVAPDPGLMTHLANADEPADPLTVLQCQRLRALARPGQALNIGNSAGILACPATRADWVRPGIMLYGVSPFGDHGAAALDLRPVMTLKTQVSATHVYRAGERIGYGDGYPRHAPTGTPVLVKGQRVTLIGRVSMDSITLDLRPCPEARPGDEVILWGPALPVEEIAQAAGTISYDLLCGVSPRVRRESVHSPEPS